MIARLWKLPSVLVLAWVAAGCDPVEEIREQFEPEPPSAHEAYARALRQAGLENSALVREWTAAAEGALEQAAPVRPPFLETGFLEPERPAAMGYRVSIRRGEVVTIAVTLEADTTAAVFLDVFHAPTDTIEPVERLESAEPGARSLEFEPRRTGEYLIRMQPELLRGGRYTLEIRHGPALAFPVHGAGNQSIHSVFGDARDGGRRNHHGIDIFAPRGTPVLAAAEAVVSRVRETARGGRVVWLRDTRRNASFYYAHLDTQLVRPGQVVRPGDTVGLVGNTGNARTTPPHLHFGIYSRGEGPIDPMPFVRRLPGEPARLAVDTSRLGDWTRAAGDDIRLRASPADDAPLLAELPRHTAMMVVAGTGGWYRVHLPDGRAGFIAARLVEEAERPVASEVLAAPASLRVSPSPLAAAIDSLPAGHALEVLGRFGDYRLVAPDGRPGWVVME